jgi:hypothetical protein
MKPFMRKFHHALLGTLVAAMVAGSPCAWGHGHERPADWSGNGTGSTTPGTGAEAGRDLDTFGGYSTRLGWYTAKGSHVTDFSTGAFNGSATWTVSCGDQLHVTYSGNITPSGNPSYPYAFTGAFQATGGTGRLRHTTGSTQWRGAFTGVPGQFFFTFDGTIDRAPEVERTQDYVACGRVHFTNVQAGILPGGIVPYRGVAWSRLTGSNVQTGTIQNTTGPIAVDATTFMFLGVVGPHPRLPNHPNIHLIATRKGDIESTWTAIFTLKIVSPTGDAVFSGDGNFDVTGGTGRFKHASGQFRTYFVTDVVPAGADAADADVIQNGDIDVERDHHHHHHH